MKHMKFTFKGDEASVIPQTNKIADQTKEKMITSITTSIHYPNQSFANVNADSGVIYKITHQQPAVSNVVEELLQEKVFTKKDLQRL